MKIRVEDLFYLYTSSGNRQIALRGLNLLVNSGECLVVNGPNGSGKSTLVKIFTGENQPSAGNVYFDDLNITSISPQELRRSYISSIDQKGNLLEDFTIGAFLTLSRTMAHFPFRQAKEWARNTLEEYGLSHLFHSYPSTISSGERQISSLLAAIANEPRILVADEPSGELDDLSSSHMYAALKKLSGKVTVLIVSHDPRAEEIADKVIRIHKGRVSEEWLPGGPETPVVDPFGWSRIPLPPVIFEGSPRFTVSGALRVLKSEEISYSIDDRTIFSNVNLSASEGELIAIIGNSGSGKSSLLRVLSGIEPPTEGSVCIFESNLGNLSRVDVYSLLSKSIGYLAQGDSPLERLSLLEHFDGNSAPLEGEFTSRLGDSLSTFSGGERARIEILKLLSSGKKILFFDEPTSALDHERAQEVIGMILDFVNRGGVAVVTSREERLLVNATQTVNLSGSMPDDK